MSDEETHNRDLSLEQRKAMLDGALRGFKLLAEQAAKRKRRFRVAVFLLIVLPALILVAQVVLLVLAPGYVKAGLLLVTIALVLYIWTPPVETRHG